MPTPETKKIYQDQQCVFDVPADIFRIRCGYKNRDEVQVRFEDNGQVYLCRYNDGKYPDKSVSAKVDFDVFFRELPEFIKHLEAVQNAIDCTEAVQNETKRA